MHSLFEFELKAAEEGTARIGLRCDVVTRFDRDVRCDVESGDEIRAEIGMAPGARRKEHVRARAVIHALRTRDGIEANAEFGAVIERSDRRSAAQRGAATERRDLRRKVTTDARSASEECAR